MLVPLTSSLYVNGTVIKPKEVLLDIGTGYFVEVRETSFHGIRIQHWKLSILSTHVKLYPVRREAMIFLCIEFSD